MGRQNAFDRVRQLGDPRLLDHTGGAFERVRQAQQATHDLGRGGVLLELRDSLGQPSEELPRLDTEILVRVLRHSATRSPGAEPAASGPVKGWRAGTLSGASGSSWSLTPWSPGRRWTRRCEPARPPSTAAWC